MKKPAAKPKRKRPLFQSDEIDKALKEAQDDIANGRVMPLPPLAEFLKSVREQHSAALQDQLQAEKK